MKECPFCKEEIQDEAVKCRHCGSMVGQGTVSEALPAELKKWNWAAFLWGPIWAIGHSVWIGLLGFVPYVGIIMLFVLGAKGNQWAWEKNTYSSIDEFKLKQKKWIKAWFIIFGVLIIGIIAAMMMPALISYKEHAIGH